MLIMIIIAASVLIQLSAAVYALWLIKMTGFKFSWFLISASMLLMSVRRIIPLFYIVLNIDYQGKLFYEFIGLVLSIFLLAGVHGIRLVFNERKHNEDKIRSLLREKEIILKEVHHRIKNNMNTIKSLLALQAITVKEPAAVESLKDAERRVFSMMVLYEKLYKSSNINEMAVDEYLPDLIDQIVSNFPNNRYIMIDKKIDKFILEIKKLQILGIIINELLTNIMKYAFPGKKTGNIQISVDSYEKYFSISIKDDGDGIPDSVNFENSVGFGLMLVKMLTDQLDGTIQIERENGTRIVVEFKK